MSNPSCVNRVWLAEPPRTRLPEAPATMPMSWLWGWSRLSRGIDSIMSRSMVSLMVAERVLITGARSTTAISSVAVSTSMTTFTSVGADTPTSMALTTTWRSLGAAARSSKMPGCKAGKRKAPSSLL